MAPADPVRKDVGVCVFGGQPVDDSDPSGLHRAYHESHADYRISGFSLFTWGDLTAVSHARTLNGPRQWRKKEGCFF